MSTTWCTTFRRTGATFCTAPPSVNAVTTHVCPTPAKTEPHVRSKRLRCSTASVLMASQVSFASPAIFHCYLVFHQRIALTHPLFWIRSLRWVTESESGYIWIVILNVNPEVLFHTDERWSMTEGGTCGISQDALRLMIDDVYFSSLKGTLRKKNPKGKDDRLLTMVCISRRSLFLIAFDEFIVQTLALIN